MLVGGAIGAGEGAMLGWLTFTLGIGALADDHGTEYRRTRRRFVRGGALLGATIGALLGFGDPPRCRAAAEPASDRLE